MTAALPTTGDQVSGRWLGEQLGGEVVVRDRRRIGAAHGFASEVVRVRGELDGQGFDLVLKLTSGDGARREAWFLGDVGPSLALDVPRLRGVSHDDGSDRAVVVMDHVAGGQGDVLEDTPVEAVERLVGGLAELHERFTGGGPAVPRGIPAVVRSAAPPRFTLRPSRVRDLRRHRPDLLDEATEHVLRGMARAAEDAWQHLSAGPRTVVHGDVHADNVLLRPDGRPVLLDWEAIHVGTAAEDVARLAVVRTDGGPIGPDRVVAAHAAAVTARGGSVDPELASRVVASIVVLGAGVVNWVGRVAVELPADDRRRRVAEAALHDLVRVLAPRIEDA